MFPFGLSSSPQAADLQRLNQARRPERKDKRPRGSQEKRCRSAPEPGTVQGPREWTSRDTSAHVAVARTSHLPVLSYSISCHPLSPRGKNGKSPESVQRSQMLSSLWSPYHRVEGVEARDSVHRVNIIKGEPFAIAFPEPTPRQGPERK